MLSFVQDRGDPEFQPSGFFAPPPMTSVENKYSIQQSISKISGQNSFTQPHLDPHLLITHGSQLLSLRTSYYLMTLPEKAANLEIKAELSSLKLATSQFLCQDAIAPQMRASSQQIQIQGRLFSCCGAGAKK